MTWMQTHTGRMFDLADPRPDTVSIDDIAHALARICRFNGHTSAHYSVAEHSCHIADYLEARWPDLPGIALAGLLHDAHEAYVGDVTFPMQQALGSHGRQYLQTVGRNVQAAIYAALGITTPSKHYAGLVKEADLRILLDERAAILGPPPVPWDVDRLEPLGVTIYAWPVLEAEAQWRARFDRLAGVAR